MEIHLIRHTSVDVPEGVCYGQTDVPLKASFSQEAAAVAAQLESIRFDKVFVSPLSRCVRLAGFCGWTDARRDPRLLELDFGAWEMKKWEEIHDPHLQEWFDDYLHESATYGESFMQQYARVSDFLDEIKALQVRRVAVFTHGGVITCAQVYAGLKTPEEAFSSVPSYGSITRITL